MLPLLYQEPVLLQNTRHADAALALSDGFTFASPAAAVPLNAAEFALAARWFPIVFADTDQALPVAVTGIRDGENLFVDARGRWADGVYVPAYLRRYPFVPITAGADGKLMLGIDRPHLIERAKTDPADQANRLFEGGDASPLARRALAFCENYHADHLATVAFVSAFREHDLLISLQADIRLPDDSRFRVNGFRAVDREKLNALFDDVLADWARKGWLDLIALAQASQANWQCLLDRHAARAAAPAVARAGKNASAPPKRARRKLADA